MTWSLYRWTTATSSCGGARVVDLAGGLGCTLPCMNVVELLVRTCLECGADHRTAPNVVPIRCLVCGGALSDAVPTEVPFPAEQGTLV